MNEVRKEEKEDKVAKAEKKVDEGSKRSEQAGEKRGKR